MCAQRAGLGIPSVKSEPQVVNWNYYWGVDESWIAEKYNMVWDTFGCDAVPG